MTPLRAFSKTVLVLVVAFACAVGVSALPQNPYQRWQLLDGTIHANARRIYERIHFDPEPIDVVFLGPSRMEAGVIAARLASALKARGLPSNVVNFSLPEEGRNTNWAVAEQLFAAKKPKLVILGVAEKPSRYGHPAFKYLADAGAIAYPGYLGDLNYFSDLIYLPFRQLRLFAADILPGGLGLAKDFDPAQFRGRAIDTTGNKMQLVGGAKDWEHAGSEAEIMRGVRKFEAGAHPPMLPGNLADVEFGDERHYTRAIAELAQKNGVKVAFLYLPYYTGPKEPQAVQELEFYQQFGPLLSAGFVASHPEWFVDYAHLDRQGADALTDWLVEPVAKLLKDPPPSP